MFETVDVVIVGAGMVGMACALGLAQKGFSVVLLESQPQLKHTFPMLNEPFDNRVFAISRASERLFKQIGVWDAMQNARVSPYHHMMVWDSVREGSIHFNAQDVYEPNLGHIIEQRVILSALWQSIQCHPAVKVCLNSTIQTIRWGRDHCEIDLDTLCLHSNLIVAADGAHSMIRKQLNIESVQHDYKQSAIVATIRSSQPHQATAYQRFAQDGPLAWLPLADPYLTSIVWTTTSEQATHLCSLTPAEFNKILTHESDSKMGELSLEGERFVYALQSHHANQYVVPRCALVGDAAHTLHPLAGMGVNLGFLDIAVLIEELVAGKALRRDIGLHSWLKRYERRRKWHNQTMIWAMRLFKEGFGSLVPVIQSTRSALLSYVDRQQAVKQFFVKWALATDV